MSDQHTTVQYQLRLPEELRDKIRESASTHNRSMNADIVARLNHTFVEGSELTITEREHYELFKSDFDLIAEELRVLIKQLAEQKNDKPN